MSNARLDDGHIIVKGARVHNLKNVDVVFPRNKFVVVTGVSGSGKSSLCIDTLFAEGQRRYAESLSSYARQFMDRMVKPDVECIKGLCPAIAIEQKVVTRTPRSTVGSMTEIYDYLRLLFARIGKTISPETGRPVKKDDVSDVIKLFENLPTNERVLIVVRIFLQPNRQAIEELNIMLQKGFTRLFIPATANSAAQMLQIEEILSNISEYEWLIYGLQHSSVSCYLLIDRLVTRSLSDEERHRLSDSVGLAFYEGEGDMTLYVEGDKMYPFSQKFELDGIRFEEPMPDLFSFNNPIGACPVCEGFGQVLGIDPDLVLPDKSLSVFDGAVAPWKGEKLVWWKDQFIKGSKTSAFPIHKPIADLSEEETTMLWKGFDKVLGIDAFFKDVEQQTYKVQYRVLLSRYRGRTVCHSCNGFRLRKEALFVRVNGKNIAELCRMQSIDLKMWFDNLVLSPHEKAIASRILIEIQQRLETIVDVGLGYLTLDRMANSLSGGESQRIQLTRSLGSTLTDSLYILDEPSIGLHSRDTEKLISVLLKLRDAGNTVVVVEHDEMMMRMADHIIDMGPLASHLGGEVVATGRIDQICGSTASLTAKYLNGELTVPKPKLPVKLNKWIKIEGVRHNNLKNLTVSLPLQTICVISGVSGSGKTTLIKQVLYPALKKYTGEIVDKPGVYKSLSGQLDAIRQVELVDQNPIGRSSRSNPVTYIKAWDGIRELFSGLPLSKMRGFLPKHFSFNVDAGRCETCKGDGEQIVEMQFLADVHLTCESCKGRRFKEEVLEVCFQEKNVFDLLEMSVDQVISFFSDHVHQYKRECQAIVKSLQPLQDTGLGYMKLGQSSDTISGGEAQRIKLASFLGRGNSQTPILFIFDEPTTGLHFHDIGKLLSSFEALVQQGHSIWIIEHNMDVIRSAGWLIELGPGAGSEGGQIVYEGLPSGIRKVNNSATAGFV
jgi:excinuclease ABC subunit A